MQLIERTGGPGSCAIFAGAQWFTKRCGRIGLFEAKEQFSLLPAPSIDSDSRTLRRVTPEPLGGIAAPLLRAHIEERSMILELMARQQMQSRQAAHLRH